MHLALNLAVQNLVAVALLGHSVAPEASAWGWAVRLGVARELREALTVDYRDQSTNEIYTIWRKLNREIRREEEP